MLEAVDAREPEGEVRELARVFEIAPTATVADVLKRLRLIAPQLRSGHPALKSPVRALRKLHSLMTGQAKAALLSDMTALTSLLQDHSEVGIADLLEAAPSALVKPSRPQKSAPPPLRTDIVSKYSRKLEETLGDEDGFVGVFKQIENDFEVGKLEAAAIAKAFTGNTGASKPAAMKKIWARHHNLMTLRAKSQSRDGRSAA